MISQRYLVPARLGDAPLGSGFEPVCTGIQSRPATRRLINHDLHCSRQNLNTGNYMNRSNRRSALAVRLGDLCSPAFTLTDPRTGWPAEGMVALATGLLPVAVYLGPIGLSHRGRDAVERRFQNPGQGKPVVATDVRVPLLLGLWTEGDSPVLVGMDARRHVGMGTRKSLFVPVRSLLLAERCGWAGHVSGSGEWILCFKPHRLADYVEARLKETRGGAR
jgi:hypothetical protein